MPWQPLPRIAFAVATYPFAAANPADLPLEIGDELYIIEETPDGNWLRGYLVAPPSLLAGLTSVKGQTLEARVFSGIFPRSCVEVREMLGDSDDREDEDEHDKAPADTGHARTASDSAKSGITNGTDAKIRDRLPVSLKAPNLSSAALSNGSLGNLSIPLKRDPSLPRPPAPVPMLKIGDETPTSASEPLIDEIASCLREWHSTNLHELLLSRQYARLDKLWDLITTLDLSRQQLLYDVLTGHELVKLREKTVWDLVKVNKLCGGEVIVRDPAARGRILTGDDSVVEVTRLQCSMSLLDGPPQHLELSSLHHLLLDFKALAGSPPEGASLIVYLATRPPRGKFSTLSESFSLDLPLGGSPEKPQQDFQRKTLFSDLSAQDLGDPSSAESELYLVVKMIATQQLPAPRALSRSSTGHVEEAKLRDLPRPVSTTGPRASRRSLMWGGKGGRIVLGRGHSMTKMTSVPEQSLEPPPQSMMPGSRDGHELPRTPSSKSALSIDGLPTAQRIIGFGLLKLNAIMRQTDEVEQVLDIWSPAPWHTSEKDEGDECGALIQELLDKPEAHVEKSPRGERLQLSLQPFSHPDAEALVKATPTLFADVATTSRVGFSGAPTKPRSDIYVTLDSASLARQNLLSRSGGSATNLPPHLQGSNLQITLEVRGPSGNRLENCIFPSSNHEATSTFTSFTVERGEPWKQTFRLSLPPADVPTSHLFLVLADLPSSPFAVAYMPLWDQKAFVSDGRHALLLYRIDENTTVAQTGPGGKGGGYLSLPWAPRGRDLQHSADITGPLALVFLNTLLCSTRFSQDSTIPEILKWRDLPREDLCSVLKKLMFVPEIEVVKLLSDVLDGLFGILVEYSGNDELEDLVFTALVRVLGIVHDRRFKLGPVVDQYAESEFNCPFAANSLVRSFTRLLDNPTDPETARKLRAALKVVRHILRFVSHARGQMKAKEADLGIRSSPQGFARHLREIFKALDAMMRNSAPVLVGSQTLAVQHFHSWLPELSGLLATEEILHIAIDFMDSCTQVKGKLILYKLVLIINYSRLDLFAHPDQRAALSANTVRWIAPHWGHAEEVSDQWRDQIRLCCSVIASQVEHLGPEIPDHLPRILDSYLAVLSSKRRTTDRRSLLFPTSYPFSTRTVADDCALDEALAELSAVLSAVSNSPAGMQLELATGDLTVILENLLRVLTSILDGEAFPSTWLSVHIYHHKSSMRMLQYLASFLLESFLPDADDAESFNTDLWKLFFTSLLKLVGSTSLALETFPEQKRRAVWKIAGDVREHGAELLRRTWEAIGWEASPDEQSRYGLARLGGYQVQYVPTLVGPIVELCLSVHEGLRKTAVEVLQTMMVSEWTLSEDLTVIQTEMIDCLDRFFKSRPLAESVLQKPFVGELLERFEPMSKTAKGPFYGAVRDLVGTLDEFLDLLVAVHSGDGSNEASNIINRLRLMEFLRDMQKEHIFVRYVHQLASLQAEKGFHTEAGLALRLHADLYDWDPVEQADAYSEPEFPAQSCFDRKEKIYFEMIQHFEEGESWNNALTAYKELRTQYEETVFDFAKLARTERAIARVYETIHKSEKLVPRYYRVIFKGLGFPAGLRDKEFIYEGSATERSSSFADRMQELHPSAQMVTSGDVDEVEGQFLVISTVVPLRDPSHAVFQRARVPAAVRDFLLLSHAQDFTSTTARNVSGPAHGHYVDRVMMTTADPFPTLLRRSEIVERREVRLSAHETGLERIVRKTQEMVALERRLSEGDEDARRQLADAVTLSVNPAFEHSVVCYRTLLSETERRGGEEETEVDEDEDGGAVGMGRLPRRRKAIKMALVDHALTIKKCLATLSRSPGDENTAPRQDELQRYFEMTFAPELSILTPAAAPSTVADAASTPSTSWRAVLPSSLQGTPSRPEVASLGEGAEPVEASMVQQVSLRQRNATLSFLGGRNKADAEPLLQPRQKQQQQQQQPAQAPPTPPKTTMKTAATTTTTTTTTKGTTRAASGGGKEAKPRMRPRSPKTESSFGRDLVWAQALDEAPDEVPPMGTGGRMSSLSKDSRAKSPTKDEKVLGSELVGIVKRGSARKRLSMLRLGKKATASTTTATWVARLDEE